LIRRGLCLVVMVLTLRASWRGEARLLLLIVLWVLTETVVSYNSVLEGNSTYGWGEYCCCGCWLFQLPVPAPYGDCACGEL